MFTMVLSFNISRVLLFLLLALLSLFSLNVSSVPFGYVCPIRLGTYTPNSPYKANLNTLLSSLSTTSQNNSFYNFTASNQGSNDIAHGLFLCRGDVSTNDCQACVDTAVKEIVQLCPDKKFAIAYYDNCLLRYSNQSIFSVLDQTDPVAMSSPLNVTNNQDRFNQVLKTIMEDVATQAANDQSVTKKFATKQSNISAVETLYGLAQCTPDITTADCKNCLADCISNLSICCNDTQGGRYLFPSCNVRYELYPFYNTTTAPPTVPVFPPPPGSARSPGKGGISSKVLIAIVVPISVFVFIVSLFFLCRKAKKKYDAIEEDTVETEITTAQSLQYDLSTIQAATNNFSHDNKIGEGGFGVVYKGTLNNGQEIAVKRLSPFSVQGVEEFKNEVVLVAKLQHRNLVRLLGFCLEGVEKILIYELVPNKSLDYFLFDPEKQEKLDWSTRYKIIEGIARGILYLHQDSRLRIIHRDLKASNILLDKDLNAKISDFGLARIFGVDQTQGNTNRVVGTYGYMSPEYAMHGQFSVKSDAFSFGVLVLEIISGKKNSSFYQSEFAKDLLSYAWKLWKNGTPLELMDSTLEGSYSRNEVIRCIHISLLCVQEDPDARPSMETVVLMLSSYSMILPDPEQPAFFLGSRTGPSTIPNGQESDQSTNKSITWSMNEASITELEPR